ncbi:Late secretory pathway protein avl9 [Saitozyma sp. JCM 24511]|nr:Late secretory pathway protein avl9 [Saitozyma sp. JCM 24511]
MSSPTSMSRPYSGYEDLSLFDNEPEPASQSSPTVAHARQDSHPSSISYPNDWTSSSSPPAQSTDPWQSHPLASHTSHQPGPSGPSDPTSPPGTGRTSSLASLSASSSRPVPSPGASVSRTTTTTTATSPSDGTLVLGVAVVDFNHLIGPTVEFAYPPTLQLALQDDEALGRLLPFLALPDGAHLSEEDYSYFHCTYKPSDPVDPISDVPTNTTLFGISCNRQLASSDLLRRPSDVTRSMVQKAVIVIASQPVFGPIRDKLGVVTRAYFAQRDFTQTDILEDFYTSLEDSLEGKASESAIYMGTSLRELIHKFRHRTLVLLKLLMLQKRVLLYGYPVEMLCTYQYSLVSLMPGLLLSLRDSGSPELDYRTKRARPTSLKSSDRESLLRYMGLPLHLFGKDAFFQPYLPLQQIEMLHAPSWLAGTTNQIVTQQKDCKYDVLVNIETMTFEFTDPKIDRMVALTPSDRRWMDDVVKTVEETWDVPEEQRGSFRGSDDDLRSRFEEYICAALASLKYAEFLAKSRAADIGITGVGGDGNVLQPFSEQWLGAFRKTKAFELWDACTDPVLFDICEPRHPCEGKPSMVSDFGLRITEGLHDLKLEESLAPTREALSSAIAAGSSSLFKAFDGVRNEVATRMQEAEKARRERQAAGAGANSPSPSASSSQTDNGNGGNPQLANISATVGGIGRGIGSFFGSRVASFRGYSSSTGMGSGAAAGAGGGAASSGKGEKVPDSPKGLRPISLSSSASSGSLKLSSSAGAGSTANPGPATAGPGGPGSAGMTGLGITSPKTSPKVSTGGVDPPRGLRPMTLAAGRSLSGSGR